MVYFISARAHGSCNSVENLGARLSFSFGVGHKISLKKESELNAVTRVHDGLNMKGAQHNCNIC
jgi:hypothetical protein